MLTASTHQLVTRARLHHGGGIQSHTEVQERSARYTALESPQLPALSDVADTIHPMTASHTTPPRPLDVTTLFPQLAPLARTATRLHPRPASPTPNDSSVGGPLLWPAHEPWPHCEETHVWDGWNAALSP